MKAFETWRDKTFGTNGGGLSQQSKGKMSLTWRAALEWVKQEAISLDERGDTSRNVINKELETE